MPSGRLRHKRAPVAAGWSSGNAESDYAAVMSADASLDPAAESTPANLIEVGRYASYAAGFERGVVVLAMGLSCWLVPAEHEFALLVEPDANAAVREQLARFERESAHWPPPPIDPGAAGRSLELLTPLIWAALVLAAFRAQAQWPNMQRLGAMDAKAVFENGEFWRIGTALFLHADAGHLLSNLASGIFVFAAVTSTIGRLRGWVLLVLAALGGNLLSAFAQFPAPYVSVGASTAIFGGLGLLTGRALRVAARAHAARRWRAMFVPLAAGFTVLALYGAGGLRVDLGAHACGFALGLALGAALLR